MALLAMPSAEGLFARAIAQSPPPSAFYPPSMSAVWAGEFVEILRQQLGDPADRNRHGDRSAAPALELLTTTPATELVTASVTLQLRTPGGYPGTFCLAPVVDGDLMPEAPLAALRAGRGHRVPLIVGTNEREGALFAAVDILPRSPSRMRTVFAAAPPESRRPMRDAYPGLPAPSSRRRFRRRLRLLVPERADGRPPVRCRAACTPTASTRPPGSSGLSASTRPTPSRCRSCSTRASRRWCGRCRCSAAAVRSSPRVRGCGSTGSTSRRPGPVDAAWPAYTPAERRTLIIDDADRVESDPRGAKRESGRFLPQL